MCGILAVVNPPDRPVDQEACRRGTTLMSHRGPDAQGHWVHPRGHIYLGHRRLSILDLSSAANQPMSGPSGAVLVYNGEIYNFRQVRRDLETQGRSFTTTSDTEVLLAALETWGEEALERLRGMFSFVLWDPTRERLLMARDPLGIKPLYLWQGPEGTLAAASEIKAFYPLPGFQPRLNQEALPEYLRFRTLAGGRTLLEGVEKLLPGSLLEYHPAPGNLKRRRWWDPVKRRPAGPGRQDQAANRRELGRLLTSTVEAHLISDVPVGLQFSGGVDSSLVAALCLGELKADLAGFFCQVADPACDEWPVAGQVAQALGLRVHRAALDGGEFFTPLLHQLTWHQDEPITHPNSVGIFMLSRLAREKVTVLLSGEAADEIFAGYDRYRRLLAQARLGRLPASLLRGLAALGRKRQIITPCLEHPYSELLIRANQFCDGPSVDRLLGRSGAGAQALEARREMLPPLAGLSPLDAAQLYDLATYLPAIMDRQDRMSMAVSVETRVPFADREVFHFALGLPPTQRATMRRGKVLLKDLLAGYLPPSLVERGKVGFGLPLAAWFKSPGGRRARDLLAQKDGPLAGELDGQVLARLARQEPDTPGRADLLWTLWALAAWAEIFLGPEAAKAERYRVNPVE